MNYELTPKEIQIERAKVENRYFKFTDYDVTEWDKVLTEATVAKVLRLQAEQAPEQLREAVETIINNTVKISSFDSRDAKLHDVDKATDQILALSATERQEAYERGKKEGK